MEPLSILWNVLTNENEKLTQYVSLSLTFIDIFVTMKLLEKGTLNWGLNCICLIFAVLAAVVVYFALVIKLGGVNREEMIALPKGRTLVRIAEKIHLLQK